MSDTAAGDQRVRRTSGIAGVANSRELPSTKRGLRTREKLVAAARIIFERDGFLDARLIDITTEAGISAGSFYTYFDSKEEVFVAVIAEVEEEMLHPQVKRVTSRDDPVEVIRASNRAYLESFRRNARFMQLLEQVASIDEGFREIRRKRGQAFIERNAKSIQELQDRNLATAEIDPALAATILGGMVSRAAFDAFVRGSDHDFDTLVDALTLLWVNALQISSPHAKTT